MNNQQKIGLIILAAGESKRLEYFPKQLLEFKGKTLLRRAAENALASEAKPVCVVLGANAEKLKAEISDLPVEIVINSDWKKGIGASLKTGLERLLEINAELAGVCVLLGDQPLVDTEIINRLIESFRNGKNLIVACQYAETVGVPAVFSSELFDELQTLSPDEGAKKIILKYSDSVEKISFPDASIDIDSQKDYELLKNKNN